MLQLIARFPMPPGMKKPVLTILCAAIALSAALAQERAVLTLREAYTLAEENYPLLKNLPLTEAAYQAEISKLKAARKPGVQLKADASFQSERPQLKGNDPLPIRIDLPLYSLSSYLEASYALYDGGLNRAQRGQQEAQWRVAQQSLETEQYTLRERINQLFVSYKLNQQQIKMLETTLSDLQARRQALEAGLQYGTVLPSQVNQLRVSELETKARRSDLQYANQGLLAILSGLTGVALDTTTHLVLPALPDPAWVPDLSRPEQVLFQRKKQALLSGEAIISASLRPKVGLFARGGVGYPNPLNFFDNQAAPYGIVGLNFQWNLIHWKKQQYEREALSLQAQQIAHQEETFVFNTNIQTGEYLAQVARLRNQVENDRQIAALQAEVLRQLAAQLEGGVITSTDYLTQSQSELRARQQLELHKMQLVQAQLEFLTDRGLKNLEEASE